MKLLKKVLSAALATTMLFTSVSFNITSVLAAPTISAGWNESLYAEWADTNPDSADVKVGYKLSSDTEYTYLAGDDLTYLVRPASTSGYGRVDIPGLTPGRYDIEITASDGTVHTRSGIKVYEYDRSGYAHFNYTEGIGGYKDDGTLKDNAIVVYVTDENKDTIEVPGYEGKTYNYTSSSSGATWTRTSEGIGNILNNNMKLIQEITITDNHPLVFRFIGEVNVPKNLTPYDTKDVALGGSSGDNGNLAVTKYGRNITLEGIGEDAVIEGWGFTFSQTSTCPTQAGKSFEVRNLTFDKYTEDGLGFQGDDGYTCPIERVWVHNNVFYPGYCANPAESDKAEGDGSCDFKRGQYYTMSYNKYIGCHKTNLVGSGTSDDQNNISLHHNWYQDVGSRQPLAANGNIHIYSTYFENASSTTVDLRGKNAVLLEENYYSNCKNYFKSRNTTCIAKSYNEIFDGGSIGDVKGTRTVVSSKSEAVLTGSTYTFSDGSTSIDNFDLDSSKIYTPTVLTPAAEVPEYVETYAGTLKAFPETESAEVVITVVSGTTPITDATLTANGVVFKNQGDGKYSATVSVGSEYKVTVSKEGYSNQVIEVPAQNDGDIFTATADLPVDYDGYAVVSLTGGSDNAPIKGAVVKLADGTELVDQNDGTYKSANQIAVGTYQATITNTGDYVAPTSAQDVVVKTTDAATEIHLDKIQGAVSVTLQLAEGETETLNTANAQVYVGTTALTLSSGYTFTGNVDINTPLDVVVYVPGWNVTSLEPSTLTATQSSTASATATLTYKGSIYTWNYTDDINTDEFFDIGSANAWSSASSNPQTYNGEELTKAIKMQSSTVITFDAPADGELVLVMEAKDGSSVYLNDVSYDVVTGTNVIPVTAGLNTLKKNKNETHLYLLQYSAGEAVIPPVVSTTTTEATTEATTTTVETSTETPTNTTPVELGDAISNNGETGISVVYDAASDSYILTDTSSELAAELDIPFASSITSGKVVIKGTAIPSTASGKWAFVRINGTKADGSTGEIASLATDSSKNITLRTDGANYAASTDAITANTTYSYEFVIDLDTKEVTLTVDGQTFTGTTTATSIDGFGAITSVSASRNVTVSVPTVGIVEDAVPTDGLNDEIMWDVTADFTEASYGLSSGETFYSNMEEDGPVAFIEGDNVYGLEYWLQGKNDPKDANGRNPMATVDSSGNTITPSGIPATGAFLKFEPTADGALTMAIKTNGGKITYVTDENGQVVTSIDGSDGTRYDVVRLNVVSGKTYYVFAGGSKTCLYYIGYTAGKQVDESTTESTTEGTTESTTEEIPTPPVSPVYGDANGDGIVSAADAALTIQHILNNTALGNDSKYVDVNEDGVIDSKDAAMILQTALDSSYTLPRK